MQRVSLLVLLAASSLAALALAACGDDDAPATTAAATTAASTSKAAATTAAATGGTPIVLENPTVLPDGLKYVDNVVGTGPSPSATQMVTVNYTGTLASSGKVFDTTTGKQPISFAMNGVIKGFSEGLSTMKVGGKRTVFIPAALGYGATGYPPVIPPNSDLIFEIELLAVK
jgi:peptidylprolyl isomerase